mmetsp:Transcript_15133/g.20613  ORF Transcript_15133/g.20613 Transcript_15133/m.20613 type:complete len:494 (-) Transcript_15133:498-1979(-)
MPEGSSETPSRSSTPPTSKGGGGGGGAQAQLSKLRDANTKYKNLLKMAKERIQAQEEELEKLRAELKRNKTELAQEKILNAELASKAATNQTTSEQNGSHGASTATDDSGETANIVRVCQRIKVEIEDDDMSPDTDISSDDDDDDDSSSNNPARSSRRKERRAAARDDKNDNNDDDDDSQYEIWALLEYEIPAPDDPLSPKTGPPRRYKRWSRFDTETDLSDFVRCDTGEPVTIPPYSLSAEQSAQIEEEARQAVSHVTEEFRRFRVRAEVARKQADATVRALQSSNVQTTKRRIEGEDLESELAQARTDHAQLASLRTEMAEQEAHWKQAYDTLLAENNSLKSSGAEALLAAQWRHRYETCLREKEDAVTNLEMEKEKMGALMQQKGKADAGKYEMKYRDLKESFRLYRKKAKEIFEAQQRGDVGMINIDRGAEDAKLAYLRNLMVNYLSSDQAVREHMEGAICTVLKFTAEDMAKIDKQKEGADQWFNVSK